MLCLIYTSGTTGPPKGVQLTHANMVAVWRACDAVQETKPGGRMISFLPSAHIADRWAGLYAQMLYGSCVYCCPDPRAMVAYSIEVKPTVWGGVPRIWEKLKAAIEIGIAAEPDQAKREATEAAIEVGRRRVAAYMDGGVPEELQAEWERADEQVLSRIRAMLGLDEVESFVVGAAPTPPEVLEFFLALGIEIRETWGMSETTAITTLNPPGGIRSGTVGPPIPDTEVKLADDGEVMVRGPQVMQGYRNMPEKTAEALTDDGWLLTGDIGEFDEQGYLRIVDRKKELIINAAGKNMSPANIEAKLKAASTLIAQAVAIGDNRPYNVALITLDPETLAARGGDSRGRSDRRGDRRGGRGGQRAPLPGRADQALHGAPRRVGARRRGADPDPEAQAPPDRAQVRSADRRSLRRLTRALGAAGPVTEWDPPPPAVAKASSGVVPHSAPPPREAFASGQAELQAEVKLSVGSELREAFMTSLPRVASGWGDLAGPGGCGGQGLSPAPAMSLCPEQRGGPARAPHHGDRTRGQEAPA